MKIYIYCKFIYYIISFLIHVAYISRCCSSMPRTVIHSPPKKGQSKTKRQPVEAPEKKVNVQQKDTTPIWETIAFEYTRDGRVWQFETMWETLSHCCSCPTEVEDECQCQYRLLKFVKQQQPKELLFIPTKKSFNYFACTFDNKQIEVVGEVVRDIRDETTYEYQIFDTHQTLQDLAREYSTHVSAMLNSFFGYDRDKVVEYAKRTFGGM
jgi:hypothetical protein